uniref:SEFIR domain-containing protein n=1 Tax=Ciona savignyi TaxID=51511 RepID=H2YE11_CIOSA
MEERITNDQSGQNSFQTDHRSPSVMNGYLSVNNSHASYPTNSVYAPSYSEVVKVPAEPDDVGESFESQVVKRAFRIFEDRKQPVQHPLGNGSPEHYNMSHNQPINLMLPPSQRNLLYNSPANRNIPSENESCLISDGNFRSSFVINHFDSRESSYLKYSMSPHISTTGDVIPTQPLQQVDTEMTRPSISSYPVNIGQHNEMQQNENIGLAKSLTNIREPEDYHRVIDDRNKRRISSSSSQSDEYFHTMHPTFEREAQTHSQRMESICRPAVPGEVGPYHNHRRTSSSPLPPPTPDRTTQPTTRPGPPPVNSDSIRENIKVFITYAEAKNKDHMRNVVQISQTLSHNHIKVKVDMLEERVQSVSVSEWLDTALDDSDFVLICVSPGYMQEIEGHTKKDNSLRALNTTYIYRRILSEYISQASRNYRFIPVILSG